jgi:hypothetical protein
MVYYIYSKPFFMLLTKEIKIRITGNVGDYYRKNNIDVKFNEYNDLPIELVNPQSHLIVDAVCDVCGKEVKVQYRRYNQSVNRGGYYTCSSKCGKDKREKTFIDRYGVDSAFKTDIFKKKYRETNLLRWGAEHFRQSEKWQNENGLIERQKRKETVFNQFLSENPKVIGQDENHFMINCEIHGESKIPKNLYSNRKIHKTEFCCECNPIDSNVSGKEILLYKLIGELYSGEIIQSYKINRKEIDVYLPELNLGFEFNGLRWHSELFVKNDFHIKKTKLCRENNIRLIHVFEDDFDFKIDIVRSIIGNILKSSDKVYARKTNIKIIKEKEVVKSFLNKNHLQGFVNTNINYGLYYNDELISLMTFMKTRKVLNKSHKDGEYELVRFCNKIGTSVVGGASKLFKHFIKDYNPISVLSYCDISWANGDLYKNLGFDLIGTSKPNYYYVINGKRVNRINYQKHKLVKQGYDASLTEVEIMSQLGYYRIFNCGNEKYLYVN